MYYDEVINRSSIIKENHIDGYLGCCEIGGNARVTLPSERSNRWYHIILCNRGEVVEIEPESETSIRRGIVNLSMSNKSTALEFRKNFHGYLISIDNKLLLDIVRNRNPFPMPSRGFFVTSQHSGDLDGHTIRALSKDCRNMLGALGNKEHSLAQELNYAHLYILLTDIADIVWRRLQSRRSSTDSLSRPQEILINFMELLHENIESETSVGFYAGKMFLSKQYLSEIVLKQTHRTIGTVIDDFRYDWCMKYINDPSLSIKKIADKMSFTDQSAFGKFFKKHSGKSPASYRKEMKISLLSRRDIQGN